MAEKLELNTTQMRNWSVSLICLSLFSLLSLFLSAHPLKAQLNKSNSITGESSAELYRLMHPDPVHSWGQPADTGKAAVQNPARQLPEPKQVLYKSLMIPGWGQIVNKQIWKVPVIYGLLGGLTWYSTYLTKRYHDYRAAYYNATHDSINPDFGETPDYIPATTQPRELRVTRNKLRNRRDFIYVTIGLAYGLNAIDAYVFAHLRSFDVSEDLSMNTRLEPAVLEGGNPGLTLKFNLLKDSKVSE